MKKVIFAVAALAAMAMGVSSCSENFADEQMEVRSVMNKGGKTSKADKAEERAAKKGIMLLAPNKTEKTEKMQKDPFSRGRYKNADIMPITTRSVALYMDEDIIRHPTSGDGSATSDKPQNGGGASQEPSKRKTTSGPIKKPLK